MIDEGKNVGGKLRHAEDGSVWSPFKAAHRERLAQLRFAMTAQVGNDSADACKILSERTPKLTIERCWMQKNYREP
jgi:hypothetical protein